MKKYKYSIGLFLCSLIAIAQDCPPDRIITDPIDETGLLIQAASTITASNTLQSGASATYKAGDEINFISGFDAISGAAFDALIEACIPDTTFPNDPLFHLQWGHYNIGEVPIYEEGIPIDNRDLGGVLNADADILEAWEITTGSPNITVALLDSGIDIGHPDLYHPHPDALRIVEGYNFLDNTTNTDDTLGHGTLVAGILGAIANNGIGIAGVDQQCKIMPLKVVDDTGTGIDPDHVSEAIRYAIKHNIDIISMSFGWPGENSHELEEAMRDAIDANVLLFAAAGNDNRDGVDYPARYPSVVGVGALSPCNTRKRSINDPAGVSCDNDNRRDGGPWGSNYGEGLDFVAPGVLLPSTDILGPTGYSNNMDDGVLQYQSVENGDYILDTFGTSMSSPFAAGVAALVKAVNPNLKNYQIRYILQETSTNIGTVEQTGHGSINARAAVEMAQTFDPNSDFMLPNLTLKLTNAPSTVGLGGNLAITYRVENTGDAPAQASEMRYHIMDVNDPVFVNIDALDPGEWFQDTINIAISPTCEGGDFIADNYTFYFEVDAASYQDNQIEEFNEFNTFFHHFEVTEPGQPDLIVENPVLAPSKGGNHSLTYDVKNNGLGQAYIPYQILLLHNFYRYYASTNAVFDGADTLITSENIQEFGLCSQDSFSKQIELNIPEGTNYLLIRIDATESITESNEANNVYAVNLMPADAIDPIMDPVAYAKTVGAEHPQEHVKKSISPSKPVVFPNPFEEVVSFQFYANQNTTAVLSVYDLEGKLQLKKQENHMQEGQRLIEIDARTLPSGMYLYKLLVGEELFSGKIIKK